WLYVPPAPSPVNHAVGPRHRPLVGPRARAGARPVERPDEVGRGRPPVDHRRRTRASPAPGAPLRQRRAFGAEGAVVAVAGIEPGVVRQPVEDLPLDVVDEGLEVLLVAEGVADPAGEQRVAGE